MDTIHFLDTSFTNFSNDSMDDLNTPDVYYRPEITITATAVINILICTCGLVGNIWALIVAVSLVKAKKLAYVIFVNLIICNLLCLCSIPFLVTTEFLGIWVLGHAMCKIYMLLNYVGVYHTSWTIMALILGQFLDAWFPSLMLRCGKFFCAISAGVIAYLWIVPSVMMIPNVLYTRYEGLDAGHGFCYESWEVNPPLKPHQALYPFLLGFTVPILLIIPLLVLILIKCIRSRPLRESSETESDVNATSRVALAIFGAYVICWLPLWIITLHVAFNEPSERDILLLQYGIVLSNLHCAINPPMYFLFCKTFRKRLCWTRKT